MFKNKLWSDHWPIYGYFFFAIIILASILIYSWVITDFKSLLSFSGIIFTFVFLYLYLIIFTLKLTKLSKTGIYVGTAINGLQNINKPNFKLRNFIPFSNIKKVEIISKNINRTFVIDKDLFLKVYKNSGETDECYINNVNGFILTLKKIGKGKLLKTETIPKRLEISLKKDWRLLLKIIITITIVLIIITLLKRYL